MREKQDLAESYQKLKVGGKQEKARITDATGISLGDWMASFTEEARADLALDRLNTVA